MTKSLFLDALDRRAGRGEAVEFWLRDDDAVVPTPALHTLIELTEPQSVPLTLAVIPEQTGAELAGYLAPHARITVAVHGWSHRSYSQPPAKKQELGLDRPLDQVIAELEAGLHKLRQLYGQQALPILVPPWNRIAPPIVERLAGIGFESLSVFGLEEAAPLTLLNTHLDIMDWHGSKGGRPSDELFAGLAGLVEGSEAPRVIGILTHHLVHDAQAWAFLDELLAATAGHSACRWVSPRQVAGVIKKPVTRTSS